MLKSVIIAGGGTGGHLFPGLAVVEELRNRFPEIKVHFIGTERGIEARILPERGEQFSTIRVAPLKGQGFLKLIKNIGILPAALNDAVRILRKEKPSVVIGVGGYASGPALLAASILGIPTAILEQNAHLGLTNRLLRFFVGRAYLSFESTGKFFSEKKRRVLGNPIRKEFLKIAQKAWVDPEGFEAKAKTIVVLGGSQGARKLNETVPLSLELLNCSNLGFRVIHQTGKSMQQEVQKLYEAAGIDAEVVSFIDDMPGALQDAALIISRAGATTVAELSVVGRPSILIPYPFAADDHQTKNARALEAIGASICISQQALTPESLRNVLAPLLTDEKKRQFMAEQARRLGKPDAASCIVDDLCVWLGVDHENVPPKPSDTPSPPLCAGGATEEKQFDFYSKPGPKAFEKTSSIAFSGSFPATYWPYVDPVVYGRGTSLERPKRPLVLRM